MDCILKKFHLCKREWFWPIPPSTCAPVYLILKRPPILRSRFGEHKGQEIEGGN